MPDPLQIFQMLVEGSPLGPGYNQHAAMLGPPISPPQSVAGGMFCLCSTGHWLFWSPSAGAHVLNGTGAIYAAWQAKGGAAGSLRFPTSDEAPCANGGFFADFSNGGSIYWTQATGAHLVHGGIRATWLAMGGPESPLGYPTSDETYIAPGGFFNHFASGGSLYWSASTGAKLLYDPIAAKWLAANGPAGSLGFPITDQAAAADGHFNDFQNSYSIYSSRVAGAHIVFGAIRTKWLALGGPAGGLGFPIADPTVAADGGITQDFQNGGMSWTQTVGAAVVPLASQEELLLSTLGSNLAQALQTAYGAGQPNSTLAFLPGSLPVTDALVQNGIVNATQMITWLATTFDSPFVRAISGDVVLSRDLSHGSASQIYTLAVNGARPMGAASDPAWSRLAAEIASARADMGPDAGSRTLTCSPADWPLNGPSQASYWTPFDHKPGANDTAPGAATPSPVQPALWQLRSLAVAEDAVPAAAAPSAAAATGPAPFPGHEPLHAAEAVPAAAPGHATLLSPQMLLALCPVNNVTSAAAPSISVHLEHACINLAYTAGGLVWWNGAFLADPGWCLPGMARGGLLPAPGSPVPAVYALPVAFVLLRNVSVTGVWTSEAQTALDSPVVSIGPIALSGSTAAVSADGVTVTYSRPAMQVVALFSTNLPVLPPNDSSSAASSPIASSPSTTPPTATTGA